MEITESTESQSQSQLDSSNPGYDSTNYSENEGALH